MIELAYVIFIVLTIVLLMASVLALIVINLLNDILKELVYSRIRAKKFLNDFDEETEVEELLPGDPWYLRKLN